MATRILIDIGSATVKVYAETDGILKLLFHKSFHFKDGFSPQTGISEQNKKGLIDLLCAVKEKYPEAQINLYATAIYRKLTPEAKTLFLDEVFEKTELFFNIIDHSLEGFYLEKALIGQCLLDEPILLINIGAGLQNWLSFKINRGLLDTI